jgi:uncharacterized damage-inducible protein DinB
MSAATLKSAALGDLDHELATTRRLLERVPDDRLDWAPHARSMTLGRLAMHLAELPRLQTTVLTSDSLDLDTLRARPARSATNRAELLAEFDANVAAMREQLAGADDRALAESWAMRRGERVIMTQPRAAAMRTLGISHIVHHRGQLSVYLRLLDVPLPPMYGPTADEAFL